MINNKINAMLKIITKMKQSILDDIEDIKKAKHENLLNRNDEKQELIDALGREKELLNEELVKEVQAGGNIEDYSVVEIKSLFYPKYNQIYVGSYLLKWQSYVFLFHQSF